MTLVDETTDLSGKESHRRVGVDTVVKSGSLGGTMVSTMVWNSRDVSSIRTLGAILSSHP